MPWKEVSIMTLRKEFVTLVQAGRLGVRELCRRFGISPTTGYKWIRRFEQMGPEGLADLSRRPHYSPSKTPCDLERRLLSVRDANPTWGARKVRAWLMDRGDADIPAPSTIQAVLRRNGRIDTSEGDKHRPWQRFEKESPNQLWQMDFKGKFAMPDGRCHPLTVLDDHSRFALGVEACADQREKTVKDRLTNIFRRYGLPQQMLMDNGSPWGYDLEHPHTSLTVWLMWLGIEVSHGRPYHPQTQGKDERFHRTLTEELLSRRSFRSLQECQEAFDHWRDIYNLERPHQALDYATPASRYRLSLRQFPEELPPLEYEDPKLVRRVDDKGKIHFRGRAFRVGKAFRGVNVALRPTLTDGLWDVLFSHHVIVQVDFRCSG